MKAILFVCLVCCSIQAAASAHFAHMILQKQSLGTHSKACSYVAQSRGLAFVASDKQDEGSKLSTREKVENYLKERGISWMEIPKALVLYELTSAGIMMAIWGICYAFQPMQRGIMMTKALKPGAYEKAIAAGKKITGKEQAVRAVTAYAEGLLIRSAFKPLIIPAKLFLTWKFQQAVNYFTKT